MKHSAGGIPREIRANDDRLNIHLQTLAWRMQVCGDPFREVCRMARSFRALPLDKQAIAFQHGLKSKGTLPEVTYTKWNLGAEGGDVEAEDTDAEAAEAED